MRRGFGCSGGIRGSGGFGCALRARWSGAGPRGVPHSVRAVPSSPLWPRKSFDGRLGSFGSGPGWNLIRWFWRLRLSRRSRLFGWFRLPVGVQSAGHPALFSSGPRLGETGGFSCDGEACLGPLCPPLFSVGFLASSSGARLSPGSRFRGLVRLPARDSRGWLASGTPLRGLHLDKSSEKARTGLNYS